MKSSPRAHAIRLAILFFLALSASVRLSAAPPDATSRDHKFKMHLTGTIEGTGENPMNVSSDVEIRYTWSVNGNERKLRYDAMSVKVKVDGNESLNISMSRDKYVAVTNGKTTEIDAAHAPQGLKDMLAGNFENPLCSLTVDKDGAETDRRIVAVGAGKSLVESGGIINGLLFHPPFMQGQTQWESPKQISLGNGGSADGKLKFEAAAPKDGKVAVGVSGTLTNDEYVAKGNPIVQKNIRDEITGTETYDLALREWVSGTLNINGSAELFAKGKRVGTMKATMKAEFERLNEDRAKP